MENDAIRQAAQRELMRRRAAAELERRRMERQKASASVDAETAANAASIGIQPSAEAEPEIYRGAVLPVEKNTESGDWKFAVPKTITDIYESVKGAVTAPGRAMSGELQVMGPDGNVTPEAIAEGLNFATTFSPSSAASTSRMVPSVKEVADAAGTTPYALRTIKSKAADDGFDAEGLAGRLRELGPEATLADVGQNLADRAGSIARSPGQGKRIVREVLENRQAGANDRIRTSADEFLGQAPNPSLIKAGLKVAKDEVGPLYDDVFKNAAPVDTSGVASFLDKQIPAVRGDAQRELIKARNMLNKYGTDQLDNNPKTLHEVRKAIDGVIGAEKDTNVLGRLGELRSNIDDLLGQAVPGIKKVDARFHELSRQEEAFNTGRGLLRNTQEKLKPDEVRELFAKGAEGEGQFMGPSLVPQRLREGMRADVDRAMGTQSNDVSSLRNYIKSKGDWNRENLRMAFGENAADPFLQKLDNETTFANTLNDVLRNSKTADRLASDAETNGGGNQAAAMLPVWMNGGTAGLARKAAYEGVSKVTEALVGKSLEKRRNAVAEALMTERQFDVINALRRLEVTKPSRKGEAVVRALLMQNGN